MITIPDRECSKQLNTLYKTPIDDCLTVQYTVVLK